MLKGMNILWGTALYAALTYAVYGGDVATISSEEVERLPGVAQRAMPKGSRGVSSYRAQRAKGSKADKELISEFTKKEWVR